MCVSLAET